MNNIDDDVEDSLSQLFERTGDEVGVTLSSNKITEELAKRLHT